MYTMNIDTESRYDVQNLCSRKLFELLAEDTALKLSTQQLQSIENELRTRQHYLQELQTLRRSV